MQCTANDDDDQAANARRENMRWQAAAKCRHNKGSKATIRLFLSILQQLFFPDFFFFRERENLQKNTTRSKQSETPDTYEWE